MMNRWKLLPLALLSAFSLVVTPVHAKKPGSEGTELPSGLQKKAANGGELPPGWQKKLQKGAVLEPEVVKQGKAVPDGVRARLPVGERGSVDVTLDGKVIRLEEKTRKILDVFDVKL